MSEPRLISPMLDNFGLGGAISTHSGVSCYPAMRVDSDERYIVKTISVPASQLQLEALLLTGAYPDAESARSYFKDLTRGIRSEIEILDKLAARRGFLTFLSSQIVPMDEGVGYEIYLLNYYRKTLERHLKKDPLTHLSAINLGIDLCAALALCREMGYLYVDLKPSNIFINTAAQTYHLGDLGFVALDSLRYASLPDRYRSDYTAPEVEDAFSTLNTTMDTYSLGLVLYQCYNNGQLPFASQEEKAALLERLAAGEAIAPPIYADYELSEIILKAIAFKPEDRWQSPVDMAEALIGYMKRNGVNDIPIGPPVIEEPPVVEEPFEPEYAEDAEEENEEAAPAEAEAAEDATKAEVPAEEVSAGEVPGETTEEAPADEASEAAPAAEDVSEAPEESEEAAPAEDWIDRMDAILSEDGDAEETDAEADEPSLRQLLESDEEELALGDAALAEEALSDDTAMLMGQVQELIEHEAPAPVVAPEPIEIPMPAPILPEAPEEEPEFRIPDNQLFRPLEDDDDYDEDEDADPVEDFSPEGARTWKRLITLIIVLILLAGAAFGGYYYYRNIYQQEIDSLTVTGQADTLTVTVVSDMDMSLLTVVCQDTYGNRKTGTLNNGQCVFEHLQPGSQYIISLEVEGFHELLGADPKSYATPERTQIVDLNAVTGAEDGTAIVTFGVEGPEKGEWTLTCSAEGEEDKVFTFTGHTYTVVGLTPNTQYLLTLTGGDQMYLIGENTLEFTARRVVYAQDLIVTGCTMDTMSIQWAVPEGMEVSSWTARCYNDEGFDQVLVVQEANATFTGLSPDSPYTLEVTAEGMTQSMRTYVTANPITITNVNAQVSGLTIDLTWTFEGKAPENGWVVFYTVDGGTEQRVVDTDEASLTIYPAAPGSSYSFVIQSADATSVFGGTGSAQVPAYSGDSFSGYGLRASNITVSLYKAPGDSFSRHDLTDANATTAFSAGDTMALKYFTSSIYQISSDRITTLIVIRDAEGRLSAVDAWSRTWDDMWDSGYCVEHMTKLPKVPGDYTMTIYLSGKLLAEKTITIR
ncbi:MAG: protein kinase [Oscillospiraceae bacterium]|nr:protein kinase [Oscillospiraceae bacterium]